MRVLADTAIGKFSSPIWPPCCLWRWERFQRRGAWRPALSPRIRI